MDCSPPGSSVHGISLARLQDWVAISFSKGSSWPGIEPRSPMCRLSLVLQADSFWTEPCVKPPSGVRRLICGICPRSCLWGISQRSLYFLFCNWSIIDIQLVQWLSRANSLQSHGLQHAMLCCPSLTSVACLNSCPWSQWCHPTISSPVVPFSSCLQT